ncbi:MAG TPA: hypothetical protein VHM27_02790, partial [Rhizomicrobium sp.]|nr:hypothetical protein [Rhizomicrobium sp.]
HKIGIAAFARYSQAADLRNGVALYATLGLAVLVLNLAAAAAAYFRPMPAPAALAVASGAILAILHSAVTARAAPLNFRQRQLHDETALAALFAQFARLQGLRCVLQLLNFAANIWALAAFAASA